MNEFYLQLSNLLAQPDIWVLLVGAFFLVRQLLVVLSAEQGRKQDLVKKLYKANMDFQVSVLVPFSRPAELFQLQELLVALANQEYPTTKVMIHLLTTGETSDLLETETLPANVQRLVIASEKVSDGELTAWGIERCLAKSGYSLFVFLNPTDMIKPDFLQNIVARGFDSLVIQGFVATRQRSQNILGQVMAVSGRLVNRISNAGRYHRGLTCRLLNTGWAVKQDVLEMVPYAQRQTLDNLEYTLRLNLENFRVTWAPNVVVYTGENPSFFRHITDCVTAAFNRLALLAAYGPRLLLQTVYNLDMAYLDQLFNVIKPPTFLIGAVLLALGLTESAGVNPMVVQATTWEILAGALLAVHLLSLFVARSKPADYGVTLLSTPVVYIFGVLLSPFAALKNLFHFLLHGSGNSRTQESYASLRKRNNYRNTAKTRFNESMDPLPNLLDPDQRTHRQRDSIIQDILIKNAPSEDESLLPQKSGNTANLYATRQALAAAAGVKVENFAVSAGDGIDLPGTLPAKPIVPKQPKEQVKPVPLSNGQRQVECLLRTRTNYTEEGDPTFQMTLEYKNSAFTTATYKILDQAFYELQTKLMSRGLGIVTCGSCGFFYNPTADVPGAIKNAGVCLFGKMGKEVNLSTDAVTVVSQACAYHTPIEQRETIVHAWRESLSGGKALQR